MHKTAATVIVFRNMESSIDWASSWHGKEQFALQVSQTGFRVGVSQIRVQILPDPMRRADWLIIARV